MPSLHEVQRAFGTALLYGDSAALEPYVFANGIAPAARVRIYRNNTQENFLATLRASFPVVERLVGIDYFRQMAFDYRKRFPSSSGNLHHVGENLPTYLARRFESTQHDYLQDVARLEWAHQEVLVAADHEPLEIERLQQVAPLQYPHLVFELHPAARLTTSPFPVWTIWNANQPGADANHVIDLARGAEHVLLLRTASNVELRRLDAAEHAFLAAVAGGASLAHAAETAAAADSSFDLGAILRRYVAAGALADFTLPELAPSNDAAGNHLPLATGDLT